MKIGAPAFLRRSMSIAVVGMLVAVLAGCTGRGGGYLPAASPAFTGKASFAFSFSCERSSRSTSLKAPAGQLRVRLSYTDHGSNPIGSRFSIQGVADAIDPVLVSAICIGQNPPPGGNALIFLGGYRLTTPAPAGFPSSCPARETATGPLCRFEVIVRDNDQGPSRATGDFFSIKLSTVTDAMISEFPTETVIYERAGLLEGGNITVD
jgi:hypothetical protein